MLANRFKPGPDAAPSRRAFLRGAAVGTGALVVATTVGLPKLKAATEVAFPSAPPQPNAFVRIAPDNTVTVMIKHLDMGQGNTTGLATIVAEELDADWGQMRTEFAPADAKLYNNLAFGPVQGTGGSTAIANSWMQLRRAGAAAREMLVAAAAFQWKAPVAEITVERGVLRHAATGRQATFGELAVSASTLPVPQEPRLKDPKDWRYVGKRVSRVDSASKTDGTAVYSLDVRRPGMVTAVVAHPPLFGATVKGVDDAAARAVPGVLDVVRIPTGVAVIARDTWSAIRGRDALRVTWDEAAAETRSSTEIMSSYKEIAKTRGHVAAKTDKKAGGAKR